MSTASAPIPGPRRRAGKRLVVVVGLAAAACLVAAAVALVPAIIAWRHRIPVVRTWGELLDLEPIELAGGLTARVGIEATSCPRGSGVLVYGLFDTRGWVGVGRIVPSLGELGLLSLVVDPPAAARPVPSRAHGEVGMQSLNEFGFNSGYHFFVRAIPIAAAGEYRVRIDDSELGPLRASTIRGTTTPFHSWTPVQFSSSAGLTVSVAGGAAVPDWRGSRRIDYQLADPAARDLPLPRLLPDSAAPALCLERDGIRLVLSADRGVFGSGVSTRLLARWWVEGTPIVPDIRVANPPVLHGAMDGLRNKSEKVLSFDLLGGPVGVRSGDRVGLQLLYAPDGWLPCIDSGAERMERLRGSYESSSPLVSNKIEILVP